MDIHEYQAKNIFQEFQIPTPPFQVASNEIEIKEAIRNLGLSQAVAKVQVHAGGRGKAGGVKIGKTPEEILKQSLSLIGMRVINQQTGKEGLVSQLILLSPLVDIKKEYYLSIILDRSQAKILIIASPEGGMEIEELSAKTPEKILKLHLNADGCLRNFHLQELCKFMGWTSPDLINQARDLTRKCLKLFLEKDLSLLEINPLVLTHENKLLALDAKISLDENALFRHPELQQLYDPTQLPPNEVKANRYQLAYVALEGNIGCMVNGAGLAMATMDLIKLYGGQPANFLDVGGGASKEKVAEGFKILLSDPNVKAIFVNIFGGIMDCGVLAQGIVEAVQELSIKVPLVVRMEGTNVQEGKRILAESNFDINIAPTLTEAAKKAVSLAMNK